MSSSRARMRLVAVTASIPLLVGAGPLVTPAVAAEGDAVRQAALVETQGSLRIGPRAGFRGDVARGVNGNTAIVAFDAAPSTTLQTLAVSVRQSGPFSIYDEFDATDGFAIYKDLDDNDRLDPADLAAGPVSKPRYDLGFSGGAVIVTVTADQAKATGEDSYLLTVHPSANISAERVVEFAIPANGIVTSAGTIPPALVDLPDIVLDSKAPAAIPVTNFVPVSRIPTATCPTPAPTEGCGDDLYKVYRSGAAESGEKIGFFNAVNDLSDSALLVKSGGDQVIYDVAGISDSSTSPSLLSIGNGTGRDVNVPGSRALNNQVNDDVFAVQWDPLGNTAVTSLRNTPDCDQNAGTPTCGVQTERGNDVTAPSISYTVSMGSVNFGSNPSSVPVTTGAISATTFDAGAHSFQKRTNQQISMIARPEHVQEVAGTPPTYTPVPGHAGSEAVSNTITPGTGGTLVANVNVADDTTFPSGEYVRSQTYLVDKVGNRSGVKHTAPVLKDIVKPQLFKVSLIDHDGDGVADPTEVYRVEFDEQMDKTDITTNVNTRLPVKSAPPATDCNASPTDTCVNWGQSPTTTWSDDGRTLFVTLGQPCSQLSPTCTKLTRLPQTGDIVSTDGNVSDRNGNTVSNSNLPISVPVTLPLVARTIDTPGVGDNLFNTNRDGVLDAIDVEFTGSLKPSSIADASAGNVFKVRVAGTSVDAAATAVSGAPDTVRLTFTAPTTGRELWRTGAKPEVILANNAQGTTLLKAQNEQAIAPFTLGSVDRAAPVPLTMKTADTEAVAGRIDRVIVQFSEPIVHAKTNPCGYAVSGYGDSAYQPAGFSTVPSAQACPQGTPPAHKNQPIPVPAGAPSSDTVALKLAPITTGFDTHAVPFVSFSATNDVPNFAPNATPDGCFNFNASSGDLNGAPNCAVVDADDNKLATFNGIAADAAGPAVVERTTADANADGRLDEVRVKFSEKLNTPSVGNAQFVLSDPAFTTLSIGVPTDTELVLRLDTAAQREGNTNVTPKLQFMGGTTDLSGNPSPADSAAVVTVDKAAPAIMAACPSSPAGLNGTCQVDDAANDEITVFFSEPVLPSSVQLTDFVVEQPAGTVKTLSGTLVHEDNDKRVVLPFANGTIDSNADSFVRFGTVAPANGVQDKVSPTGNTSTQTATVTAYKAPTVTFDLTCPTPANAGYCMDNKVNTNAAGSTAVSRWRLATVTRGTTPADSEFKTGVPAVYPETGVLPEGPLTLFFSGKDDLGRLTPEISDSIHIVKTPRIEDIQFQNATTRGSTTFSKNDTLMDGDSIHIGARAYGSDAAEWAENSAPIGGGCLAQNMSIDVRAITGNTGDGDRAPTSCNLSPATAEQKYRDMVFPVVKATGTTRYPVGTVLKVTDSDPGSIVVDGANGTLARRQFISVGARRSWMITDASVIKVPLHLYNAIPRNTKNVGYRDGAVLRSSTGYYYVENGVKRPVSTYRLSVWRISTSTAYRPTTTELRAMPTGKVIGGRSHQAGTWIKYSNGKIYQVTRNAQGTLVRRALAHSAALRTLVPTSHVYPAVSSDSALPVDTWLRGYRDGTILVWKNSAGQIIKTGVIARGSLRMFASPQAFNTLGFNASNGRSANGLAMPRVSGQAYRIGEVIDRYAIGEVVIKVTNKAGATVTAEVPNAAGLYAVGTLDPAPAGWDPTR